MTPQQTTVGIHRPGKDDITGMLVAEPWTSEPFYVIHIGPSVSILLDDPDACRQLGRLAADAAIELGKLAADAATPPVVAS